MKTNKYIAFWQTGKCVTRLEIIKQIRKYGSELMEKTAAQNTQEEEDSCFWGYSKIRKNVQKNWRSFGCLGKSIQSYLTG